ncbi:hypothetical protein GCM10011577_21390 [Pseudarthrobacter polychromogenes]|uniref:Uncharacterized protein n=1 Tax=Pseudarthrobacter polychromogenes TaxID=1676 RepID=A0ABQ1XML7_9MICC|nr:hypothetical protein GCM10011577_21390 [Pseudarthrobacter polychromogenes]
MVAMAGEEDIVAGKLAALEGDQWGPLMVVDAGCPHRWGLLQFYRRGGAGNAFLGVRTDTMRGAPSAWCP